MAFARPMDYTIDKDEFWQFPSATGQAGTGASSAAEEQQPFPPDFFEQFVVMEEGTGADSSRRPSGESFFMTLQQEDQQQSPGEGGISPVTSSVTGDFTTTMSNTGSLALSYTTSNGSSVDGPVQLASLAAAAAHKKQQQRRPTAQGQAAGRPGNSDTTHHGVLGQLNKETLEQRRRLLSGRRGQNPQPASSSISDLELLQLEGLSVNSPRRMAAPHGPAASSTPPSSMQAFGSHTATGTIAGLADNIDLASIAKNQQNHRSGARRLETIYSTFRRAVGGHSRGRVQQQQQHPNTAPMPQTVIPSHMESAKKATRRLASESQTFPTGWNGLPISPPLTEMANTRSNDALTFGNGYLDDPFFDPSVSFHHTGGLAPAAQISSSKKAMYNGAIPHTPSRTPIIKPETANGDDMSHFFPSTSELWGGLDASFATTSDLSGNIMSFDGAGMDAWGFDPSSDSGSNNLDLGGTSLPETSSMRNHHNLTIQLLPSYGPRDHNRHSAPGGGPDDMATNGLMIHMPQPQTPNTAPLLSSQVLPMDDGGCGSGYPFPDQHHPHPMRSFPGGGGGSYTDQQCGSGGGAQQNNINNSSRRPKPRAPSSGARYHHMGAATISPRKTRPLSVSSSSPSPTPGGGGSQQQQQRRSRSTTRRAPSLHRVSASDISAAITVPTTDAQSHAIRKRRSASSWLGGRRTTPTASSDMMPLPSPGGGGEYGGGGTVQIGFVNYTPNDGNKLMDGVAPSGSSKTKARREKEAREKQRKLNEAVMKAVTAAGVDVGRLKEEGIVI